VARRYALRPDASGPDLAGLALDYAAALNEQQLAAATAPDGPALVVAGAGTGKTRTLVYRLAYLVERGTPPEQIALLTFTRRAAKAMADRAAALLDGRCAQVRGGTFHALGLELLRRHAPRVGLPPRFTVLDASDAADVLDLLRTEAGLDRAGARFPKKGTLHAMFSAATNRDLALPGVLDQGWPQYTAHLDALEDLQAKYAAYKRRHGLADYDDLLALAVEAMEADDDVRRAEAGRCRHVLVDEYQDVNHLQARLVELLASAHGNVMAVGDDAQGIYRFRGADVHHLFAFPDRFPGTRLLKLERNYRSTQPILDLANFVISGASERVDKKLWTDREGDELPALVRAPDADWQARFVAQVVLDRREEGVPLGRMAVLFRAGWCSYALEGELTRRRIPFVKYGGLKLAEAAHVKDVVSHLRLAENPADAVAWNRALSLLEGVGPKTVRQVLDALPAAADPYAVDALASVSPRYAEGLKRLAELLRALREGAPASEPALAAQVSSLLAYYRPLFERVYADDFPRRAPDLDALEALALRFHSRRTLLEALALDPLDHAADEAEAAYKDESPLVLSTIHSAKGLEFDAVFLIEALDGVLPSQYALKNPEELDEERRLLYVALTRAENALFVSYPLVSHARGAGQFVTEPSRFLSGVPEKLLEPWSLVEEAPRGEEPPALSSGGLMSTS
jgi:DNA helicase-2/ATP-dependent DNA helicase PcrA